MHLVLATRNADKVREIRDLMDGLPVEIRSLIDHPDIPPIAEDGDTFEENALVKARTVARTLGVAAVADDSGLEVEALGGQPGVRSARFAGEGDEVNYADNYEKVLRLMQDVPEDRRGARFVCVAALVEPVGSGEFRETIFEGEVGGVITTAPCGRGGFGYDPIFYVPELGRTFGEVDLATKQRYSHRAQAFGRMRGLLEERLGEPTRRGVRGSRDTRQGG